MTQRLKGGGVPFPSYREKRVFRVLIQTSLLDIHVGPCTMSQFKASL